MSIMIEEGVQIDSVCTDPPYGYNFMGRYWDQPDNIAFKPATWELCLRLLKPGGHLVAFSGTRTYHRLACAIEDAGFEIRDQLAWAYGTGFPKSVDVAKAITKAGGDSQQWQGVGTALKPSWEPIVFARKPLVGTVVDNVLSHGTGGLNIDACRIEIDEAIDDPRLGGKGTWGTSKMAQSAYHEYEGIRVGSSPKGRFPANLIHDGSAEVLELFAEYGERGGGDKRGKGQGKRPGGFGNVGHAKGDGEPNATVYADSGTAARFFYCAKASKAERNGSEHPTVKPIALMRWLTKLVTPPGGLILDPFAGTGTTGEAAILEGFRYFLIEQDAVYCADIERRLARAK